MSICLKISNLPLLFCVFFERAIDISFFFKSCSATNIKMFQIHTLVIIIQIGFLSLSLPLQESEDAFFKNNN